MEPAQLGNGRKEISVLPLLPPWQPPQSVEGISAFSSPGWVPCGVKSIPVPPSIAATRVQSDVALCACTNDASTSSSTAAHQRQAERESGIDVRGVMRRESRSCAGARWAARSRPQNVAHPHCTCRGHTSTESKASHVSLHYSPACYCASPMPHRSAGLLPAIRPQERAMPAMFAVQGPRSCPASALAASAFREAGSNTNTTIAGMACSYARECEIGFDLANANRDPSTFVCWRTGQLG